MMQNRQVRLPSRFSVFSLFLAVSICPFETIGNSALAGQGPASGLSGHNPASLQEAPVISESAGSSPAYDERFKADILLVVAHPDDEGMVTAYLARALDENKRVAVLYCTRGNHGGDLVGSATAAALGDEREMEARAALRTLGIANVWFIGAPDTPSDTPLEFGRLEPRRRARRSCPRCQAHPPRGHH